RNGELRLHSGATEGDGAGGIGGVADERDAARCAAGGRWGELHAQGAGLPRGKGRSEERRVGKEGRSGKTTLRYGQVGAAGVGQGEVLHSGGAHQHIAEAHGGRRDGELRRHSGDAEFSRDWSTDVGSSERDAARCAAGGRWGELHAQGAGLPRGKG